MEIIPVINCDDFDCVKRKISVINGILEGGERKIHIDISDKRYAIKPEWNDPESLGKWLAENNLKFDITVHFMAKKPCDEISKWASLITKAVVPIDCDECCEHLISVCRDINIPFSLSIPPSVSVEEAVRYAGFFNEFQILAVSPGPSGQEMSAGTVQKIKQLRTALPSAIIEVDGGVNLETAPILRKAGADVLLSGSYIFNSADPRSAYLELKSI
jgi:ribulose-phosphate 3-epimerase